MVVKEWNIFGARFDFCHLGSLDQWCHKKWQLIVTNKYKGISQDI